MTEISFSFTCIVSAIAKLLLIALAGYILRSRGAIDDKFTDVLSSVLIKLLFPALIIHRTVSNFSFGEFPLWWVFPVVAMIFSAAGMGLGRIVYGVLSKAGGDRKENSKREFISSCGFQNSGYLPMNIILFAFTGAVGDKLLVYMFLFLIGFNFLIWSFLPVFLARKGKEQFSLSSIFNPPVTATLFSLLWVWGFGKNSIPAVIFDPMGQIGQASFPIAMLTLGAYLSRYRAYLPESKLLVFAGIATKLLIFPFLVLLSLLILPISPGPGFFLFLEAIMPSAVTLVVVGSYSGADNSYLSSVIFYSHIASIFTIPLWLAVFRFFFM